MIGIENIRKILPFLVLLVAASKANDVASYQSALSEKVAPAYIAAYQTLKNKIINPLLTYNTTELTNGTDIASLVQRVTCATLEVYSNLSTALNASEQLYTDVENKLLQLISAVRQKENEVRQVNDQLRVIEARLSDTQRKVNGAENDVRNKENELAQADANLAEEQRKLDKARQCGLRKKRFLGSILRPIFRPFKPILRPILPIVCPVLNYGGINSAKDRRGGAQGAVNAARGQLATYRGELERHRSEYNNFRNQQSQTNTQLQSLSANLAQLQTRQVDLASITQQMRKAVQHLLSATLKSSVLYDELKNMVSFELLIEPLNAILTELIENGITTQAIIGAIQISSAEVDLTKNAIDLLNAQLPTLPFIEDVSSTC